MQVIAATAGRPSWASPVLPGSAHDLTTARTHRTIEALTSAYVMTFADKMTLAKLRCCPRRETTIVQAIVVLRHVEANRDAG